MRCPACDKHVVFGSVVGDAWKKLKTGEWLLGGRPPALGKLGDCPACGMRLEWEASDAAHREAAPGAPMRVHLSALRETPAKFDGREIWMRALVVESGGGLFLSDSWRTRVKGAASVESDEELLARLAREQRPAIAAMFADTAARERYRESARALTVAGARAAWIEAEGLFRAAPDGGGTLAVRKITSIWEP